MGMFHKNACNLDETFRSSNGSLGFESLHQAIRGRVIIRPNFQNHKIKNQNPGANLFKCCWKNMKNASPTIWSKINEVKNCDKWVDFMEIAAALPSDFRVLEVQDVPGD
jgi:hypothetical protein